MQTERRSRGRPTGSGKDDRSALRAMANLLIDTPGMRPTTAIKRIAPAASDSDIRRLQVKWKAGGAQFLSEARAAQAEAASRSRSRNSGGASSGSPHGSLYATLAATHAATRELSHVTEQRRSVERIFEALENPLIRAVREMEDTPTMRLIREMENSPTMKLLKEMERLNKLYR